MNPLAESRISPRELLKYLDESQITRYHWRTVLTTGMGFFTDAYDLFVIGTVTTMLQPIWHLSTWQLSLINSTSLLSAVIGALLFGTLMDKMGRRAIYGVEAILLTVGALLSAWSPNFLWLLISRFILGIGVGGDYPASAVIVSEFANRPNRGKLVTHVFAMQGLGLVAGPIATIAILHFGLSTNLAWRILLGLGALPALLAFYLRRGMTETPRFTLHVQKDSTKTASIVQTITGKNLRTLFASPDSPMANAASLMQPPFLKRLLATMLSWFLIDVAFYGLGVSSHLIVTLFLPHPTLLNITLLSLAIFVLFALPGYYIAAWRMDAMGRKTIQWLGFGVMAVCYGLIALNLAVLHQPVSLLILYGVAYFFIEFGPNTTTFIYPSELFPTHLRGRGHGFAAAGGKLGAFFAALLFPPILLAAGPRVLFLSLAITSLLGVLVTWRLLPEPKQRALEELNSMMRTDFMHRSFTRIMQSLLGDKLDEAITNEMATISGAEWVVLHRYHHEVETLVPISWHGQGTPPKTAYITNDLSVNLAQLRLPWAGPLENTLHKREIVVNNDLWQAPVPEKAGPGILNIMRSVAAFPLLEGDRVFGILSFWDRDPFTFSEERVSKLAIFVQIAGMALINAEQFTLMRDLAYTDALTKLPNRRGFEIELENRFVGKASGQGLAFAFAILDLDYFKDHNDRFGHQSGDTALQTIAVGLKRAMGNRGFAARLGGDEFIVCLEGVSNPEDAANALQTIIQQLPLNQFHLGVSTGLSLYPQEGTTYQELYRVADKRLYLAKQHQRGQIVGGDF